MRGQTVQKSNFTDVRHSYLAILYVRDTRLQSRVVSLAKDDVSPENFPGILLRQAVSLGTNVLIHHYVALISRNLI